MKIGRLRASTRRIYTAETESALELGGKLFEAVFGREIRACCEAVSGSGWAGGNRTSSKTAASGCSLN